MHNEIARNETHEKTRVEYRLLEEELLRELARVRAVLEALGDETEEEDVPTTEPTPPMLDIIEYLTERGEPCHQFDLIRDIGDKRKQEYKHSKKPYGDVWKSLGYRSRPDNNLEFCAVEWKEGKLERARLKPKPRNPRRGGDRPEFYRTPDNFFGMRSWLGKNKSDFPVDSSTAKK